MCVLTLGGLVFYICSRIHVRFSFKFEEFLFAQFLDFLNERNKQDIPNARTL